MSQLFGPIRQLGFVVADIEASMRHWSETLGVGPFFYAPRVPVTHFHYRGKLSEPQTSVALANSGELQVELIQQRNDAPTMYRDFVLEGQTGLQHVACWTERFDEDMARITARGISVAMGGQVGENGRFVYFETRDYPGFHPGAVIELSEVAGPKGALFRMIREAASGWDGRDSVRPFPDLATLT